MDAPLAQTPANFGPKRFFGKLVPNPSCVPNLKLLVSTIPVKVGGDIFIQSGVIDIFPKFKMAAAAILDLQIM